MKKQQGFTLIELIIVITIIGILAVTGMSLLNPVEMMRRTWDNSTKTTARQILDGTVQAYLNGQVEYIKTGTATGSQVVAADLLALITDLEGRSHLKSSVKQSKLYDGLENSTSYTNADYYFDYNDDSYFVCFDPMSSAEKENAKCYADPATNLFDDAYTPSDPVNEVCTTSGEILLLCIE